jgi:hypothetical protein
MTYETVRKLRILDRGGSECRYCSTHFLPHPGFSDHEDVCPLNPMNRPQIIGEAAAMGPLTEGSLS